MTPSELSVWDVVTVQRRSTALMRATTSLVSKGLTM